MTTPSAAATPEPSKPTRQSKTTSKAPIIIGVCSTLLLVVLILAGGIIWQTQWRSLQTRASQSQQQLEQLQTLITQLNHQYQTLDQRVGQQTQTLQTVFQHPALSQQWDLITVQDLLQQAYLTLYWQKNIPAARQLLTLADDTLQAIGDPMVYPIVDQLAQEISALNTVPTVDTGEILAQLNAIAQQFSQLPTLTVAIELASTVSDATPPAPTDKTSLQYWQMKLQTLWQQLSQLIVIRHHPQPIEPLLSTAQRQLLEQQLTALIQQAQWAVLQHNASIYQQSLTQVVDQIRQSFDSKQPITGQVLKQLHTLQQIQVDPPLPEIHTSLRQVQHLLKQQMEQPATESSL